MEDEDFRPVVFLQGLMVSNFGNFKQFIWPDGYYISLDDQVGIRDGRRVLDAEFFDWRYNSFTDRLVMQAFYVGLQPDMEIRHIDGDLTNDCLDNLEAWWDDPKSNFRRVGVRNGDILDRRLAGQVEIVETGEVFESVNECAKRVGGQQSNIYGVLSGRIQTHKGYSYRWI